MAFKMQSDIADALGKISLDYRKAYSQILTEDEAVNIIEACEDIHGYAVAQLNKFERGSK